MFNLRPGSAHPIRHCACALCAGLSILLLSNPVSARVGLNLRDDVCIIKIGFYEAHFTAYQPQSSGDKQFCRDLPEIGETLFVLDYLHSSMKEVPIDFRIVRNVTNLGKYVQLRDVSEIENIDAHTVFYQPPSVHANASLTVDYTFTVPGDYIGIVTAGHPTKDTTYSAVFPFTVGKTDYVRLLPYGLLLLLPILYLIGRRLLASKVDSARRGRFDFRHIVFWRMAPGRIKVMALMNWMP